MKPYHNNPRRVTKKRLDRLTDSLQRLGDLGGIVHNLETDEIIGGNQRMSVFKDGKPVITETFGQPDDQGTVALGYVVWRGKKYSYRQVRWDDKTAAEANVAANLEAGEWNWDALQGWDASDLDALGFDAERLNGWREGMGAISMLLSGKTSADGTSYILPEGIAEAFHAGDFLPPVVNSDGTLKAPEFFDATKMGGASVDGQRKKTYLIYVAFSDEEVFYAAMKALTFGERNERREGMLFAALNGDVFTGRWLEALEGFSNATG